MFQLFGQYRLREDWFEQQTGIPMIESIDRSSRADESSASIELLGKFRCRRTSLPHVFVDGLCRNRSRSFVIKILLRKIFPWCKLPWCYLFVCRFLFFVIFVSARERIFSIERCNQILYCVPRSINMWPILGPIEHIQAQRSTNFIK